MKHPLYTVFSLLACTYLFTANTRGWSFFQSNANRSALASTAYRYRPAAYTSSSSWSFGSSHK